MDVCPYGATACRHYMVKSLDFYSLHASPMLGYVFAESKTPRSNYAGKDTPGFSVCIPCYYDYILQKLETVVAF